jgi:hypothetical protein
MKVKSRNSDAHEGSYVDRDVGPERLGLGLLTASEWRSN